ncbi:hypothetical protein HY641_02655 [Candidatus Woesearchaeota archaeon]|nr:hypothetical protein [Candidatus Woesearchaeota archaeon]
MQAKSTGSASHSPATLLPSSLQYALLAWMILVFLLYYFQYIAYAQHFITSYGPHYFPGIFG